MKKEKKKKISLTVAVIWLIFWSPQTLFTPYPANVENMVSS
jgi:hypothetical protein